jgi:acyl-coenzyme A thioesterase PaaI-like protein
VRKEQVTAKACVTKRARTLGLVAYEVTDASGSLVAKLFSTSMVLRGEQAERRRPGDAVKA